MRSCIQADSRNSPSKAVMQVATTNSVVTSSAIGAVAAGTSIVSPFTILVDRHPHTTIRNWLAETLCAAFRMVSLILSHCGDILRKQYRWTGMNRWDVPCGELKARPA
jgi:hypothetical protein